MANIILKTWAGRFGALAGGFVVAAAVWVGLGGSMQAAPPVLDPVTCVPTCEVDGRSLVSAGDDNTTLSAQEIVVGLSFTAGAGPEGNFQLFDGDNDQTNWDVLFNCGNGCPGTGALAPQLIVELFADPDGVGGAGPALIVWSPEGTPFPVLNNDWAGVTFTHDDSAGNDPLTDYLYSLHIRPYQPEIDKGWNAFKVRAAGTVALQGNQVVGFIGAMNVPANATPGNSGDLETIYPHYFEDPVGTNLTDSPYDGTWSFTTRLPPFLGDVTVFDGDMDFGNAACSYKDTDDPDSTGVPPFALGSVAAPEGVALANPPNACPDPPGGTRTGTPAEDATSAAFRRVPSIVPAGIAYQLKAPGSPQNPSGQIFLNQNPSGNKEWERFKIQRVFDAADIPDGACPAGGYPASPGFTEPDIIDDNLYPASDCRTTDLPGGVWEIQLDGMDLSNLNFWFFSFKVEQIPIEYSIGRLVWYDANENQLQDLCAGVPCPEEYGIGGVAYTVYHFDTPGIADGTVARVGVTNSNPAHPVLLVGEFKEEGLPPGNYRVEVDATNFAAAAPLNGLTSTTGGEVETGIEVGLPVCIDTNNPVGCGQPEYNEAIFGYVEHSTNCVVFPEEGGEPFEGAVHQIIPNPPGSPAGALTIRTTLATQFVDNTYGTNAIGWGSKGHTFSNLVGSDHVQLSLFDTDGVKQLQFKLDYITSSGGAPGGYAALGVAGGEGDMILGDESNITHWNTSLAENFQNGMHLTVDSPPTDSNYTTPPPPNENWIFEVYYDVTFRTDLFGGPDGFGSVRVSGVHASPSKTGSNTEVCLYEGDPGTAVVDLGLTTTKNTQLIVAAPGLLGNDTDPFNLPLSAVLVTQVQANRGNIVLNADGSFTFTPFNNFTGDAKFTYKTFNGTSFSNTVENKIKVTK